MSKVTHGSMAAYIGKMLMCDTGRCDHEQHTDEVGTVVQMFHMHSKLLRGAPLIGVIEAYDQTGSAELAEQHVWPMRLDGDIMIAMTPETWHFYSNAIRNELLGLKHYIAIRPKAADGKDGFVYGELKNIGLALVRNKGVPTMLVCAPAKEVLEEEVGA